MNNIRHASVSATKYNRKNCDIGVVHLGFGAFHRAHQAVFLDDYMENTGDLKWGIAAVNLRASEADQFISAQDDVNGHDGYFLKSYSALGQVSLRKVRSHVKFVDWSGDVSATEQLLSLPTVNLVTITVTESGYYTDANGNLNVSDPLIHSEIAGRDKQSIYAYLRAALTLRANQIDAPLTIACCDNIRQNGKMLRRNMLTYLKVCQDDALADWVAANVSFPCSMVDRITPRSSETLCQEISQFIGEDISSPIMAEDFTQWVLEDNFRAEMPDLSKVDVILTDNVDPYEETKIRVLNGGHTALAYMAALEGIETFDAAMRLPHLRAHFENFETKEVLPALPANLPFSKEDYLDQVSTRFGNAAIGDTVARICADGVAKFSIFIRPTIEGSLKCGLTPVFAIRSIASWYVFARHVEAGKMSFEYNEPSWDLLKTLLGSPEFITNKQLWGDLPEAYPEFAETLRQEIKGMEEKWPV